MLKKFMITAISTATVLSMSITAFAGSWQQDTTGYWWQRDDGSYPAGGWEWIDDNGNGMAECYYFDPSGYCVINDVTPDGYVVDANGAWIVDGVVQMQAASASDTGSAASEEMPYKSIADQYSASFYDLSISYYGSEIIEGDDYYEFPDCTLNIIQYFDSSLIANKKAGDSVSFDGVTKKIDRIMTIDGYKWYCFDDDDDDYEALIATGNGLVVVGIGDYVHRTTVYAGPVRFSKDATIITGTRHLSTTPQAYFLEASESHDPSTQEWGYGNYWDGYLIDLYGSIKVDDRGYVNWYQELYAP